jgi:hypothetical protein
MATRLLSDLAVRATVLEPAALTTAMLGSAVLVSVPREAGVVELGRAIALEASVAVSVEISPDEIALTFSRSPR